MKRRIRVHDQQELLKEANVRQRASTSSEAPVIATKPDLNAPLNISDIRDLHQTLGNQGVQRLISQNALKVPGQRVQRENGGAYTKDDTTTKKDGSTTTTTRDQRKGVGYTGESTTKNVVSDGMSTTTSETNRSGLAGVEVAAKRLSETSPEKIKEAVEYMARAGVFGEAEAKIAIQRGALKASAHGKAEGMIGAQVNANFSAEIGDIVEGIKLVAEVGAKVGASGSLYGMVEAGFGAAGIKLEGKLEGFAGAMATAKGTVEIGLLKGLRLEGSAEAKAGAEGKATGTITAKLGNFAVPLELEGTAFAGAKAGASGKAVISLTGIAASGKAEAFAGVKTSATGALSFKHKDKTLIKLSGEIGVNAGAGGKAAGKFEFENGKLVIGGHLLASLGIGGEAGAELEVDFVAIGEALVDYFKGIFSKEEVIDLWAEALADGRIELDPHYHKLLKDHMYNQIIPSFRKVADKSKEGVIFSEEPDIKKMERLQNAIENVVLRNEDLKVFAKYRATDEAYEQAAREAFGDRLKEIGFSRGRVVYFVSNVPAKKKR